MSARGISQTSSGEAATWESPAQKCWVRTRKQRESRRSLDRSSIFSRKIGMRIPAKLGTGKRMQPTAEAVGR